MKVFLLSVLFAAVWALQVPPLWKQRRWRELAAFAALMILAMAYGYGVALELPVPNPARAVEVIYAPVTRLLQKMMG
ncbi:hypothetical protein [Desulfovirgula thermocuniculi]|uniref:hypothetical protein n=1 Tax=Desulfovirgula thermocuniculi TaxID=348842 RepID=UPI000411A039|nr:hypothetical protein [Desulfovirgula thermocuniculi]